MQALSVGVSRYWKFTMCANQTGGPECLYSSPHVAVYICLMLFEHKKDEEEQRGEEAHLVTQGISHPQHLSETLVLNLK